MKNSIAAAVIAASLWAGTAQAQITVGFVDLAERAGILDRRSLRSRHEGRRGVRQQPRG